MKIPMIHVDVDMFQEFYCLSRFITLLLATLQDFGVDVKC